MNQQEKKKRKNRPAAPYIPTHEVPEPSVPNRAHTEMSLGNFDATGADMLHGEMLGNFDCGEPRL